MVNSHSEKAAANRRLAILDPARAARSEHERKAGERIVQLFVQDGWAVDWHVDSDVVLEDTFGATVWNTLKTTRPADETPSAPPQRSFFWRGLFAGVGRRLQERIEAADRWARATWHARGRGFLMAAGALFVWAVIRVFYRVQFSVAWTRWRLREARKTLVKGLYWDLSYPYVVEPVSKALGSAYWRLLHPLLRPVRRAILWFYWRFAFVFVVEPAVKVARAGYWRLAFPAAQFLRRLTAWIYWRLLYPFGVEPAYAFARAIYWKLVYSRLGRLPGIRHLLDAVSGKASRRERLYAGARPRRAETQQDTETAFSHIHAEHGFFEGFGAWLKARIDQGEEPDAVLIPAAEPIHFEALLTLVPQLNLEKPFAIPLIACPTRFPVMLQEPGLVDAASLRARLASGSPFQHLLVLQADEHDPDYGSWLGIPAVNVEEMADHATEALPDAVFRFICREMDEAIDRQKSLTVDAFGPLAIVSSALWGRVGSSAIFDSQVRSLLELGFRVVRLYFDHWPHHSAERMTRIKELVKEDQDQVRPHYHAVMERNEPGRGDATLLSQPEFLSASPLLRMAMLLADNEAVTPKLVEWSGRNAKVAVVNHAPHVLATQRLTDAPIILETHDIYAHVLDLHGIPGFVPKGPDGESLRLEEEMEIWRSVDCCINLSETDQQTIAPHAQRALYLKPIRDRSDASDRPWSQVARENGIPPEHVSPGNFDIMLWGSWHDNNVQSIKWFLEEVRPLLERQAKLRIVIAGRVLRGLGGYMNKFPDVVCCDFVDRLEDFASRSSVLVLPDRDGTGISVKAMDVLAWGGCFSATVQGLRGLEFGNLDVPLTESAKQLAADILALLESRSKREQRSKLADELYRLNNSHGAYLQTWRRILQDIVPDAIEASSRDGFSINTAELHSDITESSEEDRIPSEQVTDSAYREGSPKLTAIVATYDRYDVLPDAIRSLLHQKVPAGFLEIVVVDNSPNQEFAASFAARYADFPSVNYILEPVPGLSNARNVGSSAARADRVAFIDDDAIADPNWARNIVDAFEAFDGKAGVVGGRILPRWVTPQPGWLPDSLVKYLTVIDWGGPLRILDSDKWVAGCNIAFDKAALEAAGGFSRALGRIGHGLSLLSNEETEVIDRIESAGLATVYAPDAAVEHVIDPARLEQRWFRRRSAWQAVSDFIKDSQAASSRIRQAGSHLRRASADRGPQLPLHFFRHSEDAGQMAKDVGMMYDLVSVMLAGGIEEDANGQEATPAPFPAEKTISDTEPVRDPQGGEPRLSVIIATYDRYSMLPHAISALKAQTLPRDDIEIIIIDNSPDKSAAAGFAGRYRDDPQITYVIEERAGLSNARNVGIRRARADYVAFVDDDAIAKPEWAAEILDAFEAFGERAAVVGGRVRPRWVSGRPEWLPDSLLTYLSVLDWGDKRRRIRSTEWLVGCNIAFHKSALLAAGGFSTSLGRIGPGHSLLSNEENEVIAKILADGGEAIYAPAASVEHVIDPRRLNRQWFRRRAAWQAVSDFIHDAKKTTAYASAAAEHLRHASDEGRRVRITGIYSPTTNPDVFGREVGLCYDIVISLLTGGEEVDLSGNRMTAASLGDRVRGRARRAVLANSQLTRLVRKMPRKAR